MEHLNINKTKKNLYRIEIDGLRAIAVICVIINHFNKNILLSGFLGVDIFFVISGYVITASLASRKNISFREFISSFYQRRIRRLIPALSFFIFIFTILINLVSFYPEFYLKSGISSLFGFSNIIFYRNSLDYFAEDQMLNPFIHTWSLGVEEQFYFLFPFLIWFTGFGNKQVNGRKNLTYLILVLSVISLFCFLIFYHTNQSLAYFLMPLRFWEISAGCLCFLINEKKYVFFENKRNLISILIFFAIAIVMFLPSNLGGYSHLIIVSLTFIFLLVISKGTFIYELLTKNILVHIGLISYSLYLWHWGIITISLWTIGIHWWSVPFQGLLIYLLSLLSYNLLEVPFRNQNKTDKIFKAYPKIIFSFCISLITLFSLYKIKPLKGKLYLGDIGRNFDASYYDLSNNRNFCPPNLKNYYHGFRYKVLISAQCFDENRVDNKNLFLLGDSHSYAFLLGAEHIANKIKSNLFYIHRTRKEFRREDFFFVNGRDNNYVESFNKEMTLKMKKGDLLFIVMRMTEFLDKDTFDRWFFSFQEFNKDLKAREIGVILFTPMPEFKYARLEQCKEQNSQWFNRLNRKNCSYPITHFNSEKGAYFNLINSLEKFSNNHENIYLFNALKPLCPNSQCNFSLGKERLFRDSHHISDYTAKFLLAPKVLDFLYENKLVNKK